MDTMLSDLDFTVAYLDDILMNSQNVDQRKEHVHNISRIQEYGFKLKESKCDFFMKKIKCLGHIINRNGRRPDPECAAAIKDMPAPENVSSFQSFLRVANYYQVFVPNMYNLCVLSNELLKTDNDWEWTPECQEAFVKIKEVLTLVLFLPQIWTL